MVGQPPKQKDHQRFDLITKDFDTFFGLQRVQLLSVLPSERDENFLATAETPSSGDRRQFVVKVFEAAVDPVTLRLRLRGLSAVSKDHAGLVQTIVAPLPGKGDYFVEVSGRFVAVVEFLPGQPLADYCLSHKVSEDLLRSIGRAVIAANVHLIADEELREIVKSQAQAATEAVRGLTLPCQVCQNDANEYNIIIGQLKDETRGVGILDFGDLCLTYRVADIAICLAYLWLVLVDQWQPVELAEAVLAGFKSEVSLTADEERALVPLAIGRICVSISVAARNIANEPDNHYHRISQANAVKLMKSSWVDVIWRMH
ncbi:Homoserine Kinase [Perkinsus olseni]|uniref:Hydroxylysine kinase n=1 Tax=Perkinsus olseni TaxID=32597 RepID=A0A7J6PCS2_PEROL|nr:Homoserine Kinase [Perkinsus olseni]